MDKPFSDGQGQSVHVLGALAAGLIPFGVYLYFLCPTIAAGDSGELTTCAAILGIPHPPGYPLFTMLGHVFTLIPMNTVAWRVNLMSAVFSALACLFVYLTLMRLTKRVIPSLGGALGLAFSRYFWHYAEVAEVFSLNCFFAALLIYLAVRLQDVSAPERYSGSKHAGAPLFLLGCFVSGLALTNHQTLVLLFPALLCFIWMAAPVLLKDIKVLGTGALLFLAGLTPYAYVVMAAGAEPAVNWDNPVTFQQFFRLITRADYGSLSLLSAESSFSAGVPRTAQIYAFLKTIPLQFGVPGTLLILLGVLTWRRHQRVHLLLWLGLGFGGFFFVLLANMPINNPLLFGVLHRFYLLPAVILSLWLGLGLAPIAARFEKANKWKTPLWWVLLLILGLVTGWELTTNVQECDFRKNYMAEDFAANILKSLPPDALFFVRGDVASMGVDYLQMVEKKRPDVITLDQEKLTYEWYYDQAKKRFPDIVLRGKRYDGVKVLNKHLIGDNIRKRPVLFYGFKENSYLEHYKPVPMGLVSLIIFRKQKDSPAVVQKMMNYMYSTFTCRTPQRKWPDTSFEYLISRAYARPCNQKDGANESSRMRMHGDRETEYATYTPNYSRP